MASRKASGKKLVTQKQERGRVEGSHVQPSPAGAAVPPLQPGAPAFQAAVVGPEEGLIERVDLLSAQGMTFGALSMSDEPPRSSFWTPV